MGQVAKYNIFKAISTLLMLGAPTITMFCCGDFIVHRSETAISAAGMFTIIVCLILFKDKIMENWKTPSAFVLCTIILILIVMIENIILPMKCVCIVTMIVSAIDEVTFKRLYKNIEVTLPDEVATFKHLGFIFCSSKQINKVSKKG